MAGRNLLPGSSARMGAERAAALVTVLTTDAAPRPAEVTTLLREYGELDPRLNSAEVAQMRAAAFVLLPVFEAAAVADAASLLNELLAAYARPPRLTTHDGSWAWHLHADRADDGPWGEWLLTSSCLALAVLLADRQELPGGICASPSCRKPFAHNGSGSPRRYCSSRCATRERVAAHRRRR